MAVCTGLSMTLFWRYLGWNDVVYDGMIGVLAGLIVLLFGQNYSATSEKGSSLIF